MFNPTWFYVGAVYAGAVALARKAGVELPRRVAFFFYTLVFVFMFLPLTNDYVNLPVDFLKTLPPWAYTLPLDQRTAARPEMNDVALQIVPWAHQVRESWRALEPPLWNHLSAAGYPLLASAQSSAFSPFRLLGLPLSLAHAMTFEAAMKVLVALTFMFLWCRRRGYSELASVTGAVAFGFSTFILVWLHFPLITTACLVPAVFYVIDLLVERRTYPRFVAGAVVWTLMLFGGHPETVSHTFFIALLYVLWIVAVERAAPWRLFLTLGGALAISALLAAPLLAPFAEAVTKSKRYYELQKNPLTPEVPFSDWPSARLLLQPFDSWGPAHAESVTGFAGFLGVAAWIALVLHVVRRRAWRSREMFFVLATVMVVGIILSWPGVSHLFHVIFRLAANARLRLFLAFFMAIQTAVLIDLIPRDRKAVLAGVGIAAAILLGVFFTTTGAEFTPIIPSLVVLAVAAAAALPVPRSSSEFLGSSGESTPRNSEEPEELRGTGWVVLALLAAVTFEVWSAARSWVPDISQEWMYPKTPLLRALDEAAAKVPPNEPFRIVGSGPAFFPNVSAVYGYEDIRAHDPMANGNYIRLLALVIGYDEDNYFAEWNEWEKHFADFLNVRFVLTTLKGELPPRFRMLYDGDDGRLFENTAVLPRFFPVRNVILEFRDEEFDRRLQTMEDWRETALLDKLTLEEEKQRGDFFNPRPLQSPLADVKIVSSKPTDYQLHVKAPRYSLVASSVPWWPGWKVLRNGARIEPLRVNGGFLGFVVPEGEVDVRVWYDPWSFRLGAIVAGLTIAALVAFGIWRKPASDA